ncbi:hypothetical protein DXK94_07305 [Arthrobacter sp. RT-1]|uniref:hypothetical protein n=1 Tax=Arthrobacter sp. RT-1 TaxID=2292263 RepID=UPI000E1E390F|nr:hypothetical protein [Arthrobacter sp. RT-1]RDV10967.1 hypothetical protein DXK94_07305 [Arthrobacter sp. RT-1]
MAGNRQRGGRKEDRFLDVQLHPVRKLRVHWPISGTTFAQLAKGKASAFRDDPGIAHLLQALTQFRELGDFGNYKHVFESGLGFEGFTTAEGANPTLGRVGEQTLSPTFVFTTYFDASLEDAAVERFMRQIVDIHPWEVPVIELTGPISVSSTALAPATEGSAAS